VPAPSLNRRRAATARSTLGALAVLCACAALAAAAAPARGASVAMSPAAGPPGTAVVLRGSGFLPGRSALIRLRGRVAARAVTDRLGRFTAAVTVPAGAPGARLVSSASGGRTVTGVLLGTARATARTSELATSFGPRVRLSPSSAVPGALLRVTASGMGRSSFVRVLLGQTTLGFGRASTAGFFARLVRLPSLPPARRALTVRAGRTSLTVVLDVQSGVAAATPPPTFTLAAAGDIACPPGLTRTSRRCHHGDTAGLLARLRPNLIAPLGDLQYDRGELANFAASFDATWGRFKERLRPAPGSHEYATPGAAGYYGYLGALSGPARRGYYSYDLGAWHVVSLNSNCERIDCGANGAQVRWLRADLAANPRRCVLAYWHHARFSSGVHGDYPFVTPLWQELQAAGADVVLSGHDHNYERFAPLDASGARDDARGIREFVVGTGGIDLRPFTRPAPATSEMRDAGTFGVLLLTLHADRYDWRFVPEPGGTFADQGSAACS